MPVHRQSLSRYLAAAAVVVLAVLAGYVLHDRAAEAPEPAVTEVEAAPVVVSANTRQDSPVPDEGITPELLELMRHGLPTEGCDGWKAEPDAGIAEKDFKEIAKEAVEVLSTSNDPEYLLAAALLDFDRDKTEESELLARALAQLPDHPVALWHRLQHCSAESCDQEQTARAATAADPTNGMLWLEIASGHLEAGDWPEAERAIRRAIASQRFDTYANEYAMLIERGLAASTDFDYPERVIFGIGVAAAVAIPSYGEVSRACQSDENDAVVWVPLCDEIGKSLHNRSRELISTMIGWGYRKVAAERAGDNALAASLKRESEALYERYVYRQIRVGAAALIENDPNVLRNYLDDFRAHGELGAIDRLVDVAERLRADDTYDQCNFVMRQPDD